MKKSSLSSRKLYCRYLVNRAQKLNLIIKPASCVRCSEVTDRLEKHHHDYTKPLSIRWLCKPCHIIEDRCRRKNYPEADLYLLENDNVQHEHRLALEAWYAKRHGRRVPFKAILHELMAAKVAEISRKKP